MCAHGVYTVNDHHYQVTKSENVQVPDLYSGLTHLRSPIDSANCSDNLVGGFLKFAPAFGTVSDTL